MQRISICKICIRKILLAVINKQYNISSKDSMAPTFLSLGGAMAPCAPTPGSASVKLHHVFPNMTSTMGKNHAGGARSPFTPR